MNRKRGGGEEEEEEEGEGEEVHGGCVGGEFLGV